MASSNFERSLDHVLTDEGGYVDHPRDPGGATNMGITHGTLARWRGRPVSKRDVRRLTRSEAGAIYRKLYWDRVEADRLPTGVDYAVFDAAVHSGPRRAVRWLQAAVGARPDGVVGPETLAKAAIASAETAVRRLCRRRLRFLQSLRTWRTFGKGWARRMNRVERTALAMATDVRPHVLETREEDVMNDTKHWYQSTTVWAAVVTLLATLTGLFGFPIDTQAQSALAEMLPQLVASLGATVALIGRLGARSLLR